MFRKVISILLLQGIRFGLNTTAVLYKKKAGQLALALLCRPRRSVVEKKETHILATAQTSQLKIADQLIGCFQWPGTGPTVLLVHGWESQSGRWELLIETLQKANYNIVAIDAPAHGRSSGHLYTVPRHAQAIAKAIEHFQPSILIGHSAGGMAAVYCMSQIQETSVKQLVLIATPSTMFRLIKNYQEYLKLSDRTTKALIESFEDSFQVTMSEFATGQFIKNVPLVRGLVIHDKKDDIADYSGGLEIHQNWPGSKMISTEGLGHSLRIDEVNASILEFLDNEWMNE